MKKILSLFKITFLLLFVLLLIGCSFNLGNNQTDKAVGIIEIKKTGSEGLVDTYTIVYSDGTTSTFTVTNGAQGEQGMQGEKGEDGHTPTISIGENGNWFIDGKDTSIPAKDEVKVSGVTITGKKKER